MSTLMMSANVLDAQAVQVEEPIRFELDGGDRHYYIQDIKYNGQYLYLQSDWFLSEGPKKSPFGNKTELLVKVDSNLKQMLKAQEDIAKEKLTYPKEYNIDDSNKKEYFKCLPDKSFMFGKIGRGIQCYDKSCKPMTFDKLQYGNYRVIFMMKGIYIGTHGASNHLASLHLKIMQIQCDALNLPCMFNLIPAVTPVSEKVSSIAVTPISTAVGPQQGKKRKARQRLQRQNAVVEPAANMEHVDEIFESLGL